MAVDPANGDFVVAFAFDGYGYMEFTQSGQWIRTVNIGQPAWYSPFIAVNAQGDVFLVQSTGLEKNAPNVVFVFDANGTSSASSAPTTPPPTSSRPARPGSSG